MAEELEFKNEEELAELMQLQDEIAALRQQLIDSANEHTEALSAARKRNPRQKAEAAEDGAGGGGRKALKLRRKLNGHFGKVYALEWSRADPRVLVTAAQDGKLLVWDAFLGMKTNAISLTCGWSMTCGFAPSGRFVASGGLDNDCSIYSLQETAPSSASAAEANSKAYKPTQVLRKHEGYLSRCYFVSDDEIITASGDATCVLWDVTTGAARATFEGHKEDVTDISVSPDDTLFVSASLDETCRLWDHRIKSACVFTFYGHEADVNEVRYFPDGNGFITGSQDGTVRYFDIRARRQLQVMRYKDRSVTSVTLTNSGATAFSGFQSGEIAEWDLVEGTVVKDSEADLAGDSYVSGLEISPDGKALAATSWDSAVRVFA